jgi:hypothetical protein
LPKAASTYQNYYVQVFFLVEEALKSCRNVLAITLNILTTILLPSNKKGRTEEKLVTIQPPLHHLIVTFPVLYRRKNRSSFRTHSYHTTITVCSVCLYMYSFFYIFFWGTCACAYIFLGSGNVNECECVYILFLEGIYCGLMQTIYVTCING